MLFINREHAMHGFAFSLDSSIVLPLTGQDGICIVIVYRHFVPSGTIQDLFSSKDTALFSSSIKFQSNSLIYFKGKALETVISKHFKLL
jgi:hypothetical protein